jgi:outer membrane receptor protein involved in Fe transport
MRSNRRLAALLLSLCAAAGRAQDAPPAPPPPPVDDAPGQLQLGPRIEEIVVTAQKREESINSVPVAITAVTGETLQALGVTDTRDLGAVVPGFTAADSGYNTPVYTLRGVGFNDTTYTATSTVGVYVDEASLPYSIMTKGADLDLERVEVLKGPQGILYGRNTTGGAINYIARKPTQRFDAGGSLGYANYDTVQADAYVSGPLGETLHGRLALNTTQAFEGWQRSLTRPDDRLGKQNKAAARGILDWTPLEDLDVSLTLSGWYDRSDSQAPQPIAISAQNPLVPGNLGVLVLAPQVRNAPTVAQGSNDITSADWCPCLDFKLNDSFWSATLKPVYHITDTMSLTTIVSNAQVRSHNSTISQDGLNTANADQRINAGVTTSSVESRLAGQLGERFHWMIGANDAYDSGDEDHFIYVDDQSALFPDPVTGQSLLATRIDVFGYTRARALGVFGSVDWEFLDNLKLTLGARYADEDRTFTGCSREPAESQGVGLLEAVFTTLSLKSALSSGDPSGASVVAKGDCLTLADNGSNKQFFGELHEHNYPVRAILDWTPLDKLLLYASFNRGFKSGGFPVTNSSSQVQYTPVTQEKLDAYEVGSKWTVAEGLLHFDFAAFHYGYRDKQLLTRFKDPIFGPLPILRNAPHSHVLGAELAFQLTPLRGLFISGAGSYIKTRIDEFTSTNIHGNQEDFAGHPFNFAPLWQYTALVDYDFPLTGALDLGLGMDYSFTGKTNSTLEGDPLYAHRPYGLTGARIRLGSNRGDWNVLLWGRNIFNTFSQLSIVQEGDTVDRLTGQPRRYGVTFSYNYR